MLEFKMFKNAHGQEAAPPDSSPSDQDLHIDPLDFERCQVVFGARDAVNRPPCDRPPTYVMVENEPRSSHGKIHSMTICDQCAKGVMAAQGPNYALFTPLKPPR